MGFCVRLIDVGETPCCSSLLLSGLCISTRRGALVKRKGQPGPTCSLPTCCHVSAISFTKPTTRSSFFTKHLPFSFILDCCHVSAIFYWLSVHIDGDVNLRRFPGGSLQSEET